ncbi:MAG: hypothetical protein D6780_07810, partial [Candidatus Dadabacteria bacterium]
CGFSVSSTKASYLRINIAENKGAVSSYNHTALEECGKGIDKLSNKALARQLLIGFKKVVSFREVEKKDSIFLYQAKAIYLNTPLTLFITSCKRRIRGRACVRNIIFWQKTKNEAKAEAKGAAIDIEPSVFLFFAKRVCK